MRIQRKGSVRTHSVYSFLFLFVLSALACSGLGTCVEKYRCVEPSSGRVKVSCAKCMTVNGLSGRMKACVGLEVYGGVVYGKVSSSAPRTLVNAVI